MRLLRPEALWLLLAALPLLLLHLRRVRRRVVPVASVRLWKDLTATGVGRRGFRRLREVGALALLLLALVALVGALADPVTGAAAMRPRSLVIVLDASVTMNARDGDGTRFDAARRVVADALAKRAKDDDVTVWLAEEQPWVLAGPTRHARDIAVALASAEPTLQSRALAAALERARAARDLRREPATYLIVTDAPGAASLATERNVLVASVGTDAALNIAVRGVDVTGNGVRVRIAALEGAGSDGTRTLSVTVDGEPVSDVPVLIDAGREIALDVLVPGTLTGRLEARLLPPDDFPDDDANGLVLRGHPPLRALVTAPDARVAPFLLEALRALPELIDAEAALLAGPDAAADVISAVDVVVADGVFPEALVVDDASTRPYIAFVAEGDAVERPLLWGVGSHPVLEGVDLAPLRIERASPLRARAGETLLIDSAAGPLGLAGERDGTRYVRFGFRPEASTLPLEAAFPLLVRNSLRWVRDGGGLPPAVVAGEPLEISGALPPGVHEIVLSTDAGTRRIPLGPDAAQPSTPLPLPGAGRVLRVGLPGGASLGETIVQWRLPEDVRLGAEEPGPRPAAALAALPKPLSPGATERRLAPLLSAAAAALLLLGAALLSTRPAGAGVPSRPVAAGA